MLQLILTITSILKLWMFYEAMYEERNFALAAAILIIPGAEWAYLIYSRQEVLLRNFPALRNLLRGLQRVFKPGPSTETLRRRYRESPSIVNQRALANGLLDGEHWQDAYKEYQALLRTDSSSDEVLYGFARAAVEVEEFQAAEQQLRTLIARNASYRDHSAVRLLVRLLERCGRPAEALAFLESNAVSSKRILLQVERARLLLLLERRDEAIELLKSLQHDYRESPAFVKRLERAAYARCKQLLKEANAVQSRAGQSKQS